MFDFRLSYCIT